MNPNSHTANEPTMKDTLLRYANCDGASTHVDTPRATLRKAAERIEQLERDLALLKEGRRLRDGTGHLPVLSAASETRRIPPGVIEALEDAVHYGEQCDGKDNSCDPTDNELWGRAKQAIAALKKADPQVAGHGKGAPDAPAPVGSSPCVAVPTESATTQEMRHAGKPASHAPASSADLVLVPRNPTVEMLTAGAKAADLHSHSPRGIWAAMLAAAGNHERRDDK